MAKAIVHAGVCGFTTEIDANSVEEGDPETTVTLQTDCPNYQPLNEQSFQVDAYEVCFGNVGQDEVFDTLRPHCPHGACPVPTGVIKAVEVAAGLALPRDVSIEVSK